jgi:hypothetical protein
MPEFPDAPEIGEWLERAPSYGHAGPAFLCRLAELDLFELRRRWRECIEALRGSVKDHDKRTQLAVIALGEALSLEWIWGWSAEVAFATAIADAVTMTDRIEMPNATDTAGEKITQALRDHCAEHPDQWVESDEFEPDEQRQTFAYLYRKEDEVRIMIKAGREHLRQALGADPHKGLCDLRDAGVLIAEKGRTDIKRALPGVRDTRVLCFRREALLGDLSARNSDATGLGPEYRHAMACELVERAEPAPAPADPAPAQPDAAKVVEVPGLPSSPSAPRPPGDGILAMAS